MASSTFRKNNPALGFELLEVEISNLLDFGTGKYTCVTQPNALALPFPITCAASSQPWFQILLSIFPGTGEILVLLGKVDNTPPLSEEIYQIPNYLDSSKTFIFRVSFKNWKIDTFSINERRLAGKITNKHCESSAGRYVEELVAIANGFRDSYQPNNQEPLLEQVHPRHGPAISFLQTQKKLIEELFGKDWITNPSSKTKSHPAYKRWKLCDGMLTKQRGIDITSGSPALLELVKMAADSQFIVICTKGSLDSFSLGSLANYGDAKVQKRLTGVIPKPSQYLDVITELSFAASQILHGNKVIASEELGLPDFSLSIPGWQLPFAVDCKHLHQNSSDSRIEAVITKANKQIKALRKPCYGLAVLDVSEKVSSSPHLSDDVPREIIALRIIVAQAISKFNTAISAVLLVWDDFTMLGKPEKGDKVVTIWLRRRFELLQHSNPRYPLDGNLGTISVGNTVMLALRVIPGESFDKPMVWRPL